MRSAPSAHRRRHARSRPASPLQPIARLIDELGDDEPGHLLVHILDEPGPDLALGLRSLDRSIHPFTELAGFTAPAEWTAFAIRVRGRARHLDAPDEVPEPVSTTFVVDRAGHEASVLRAGDGPVDLPGHAEGTIADLCRRVLGRPTAPPPAPTSRPLWLAIWLDRLMAAWNDPARRRQVTTGWAQVAALHPALAASPLDDPIAPDDPAQLVALAHAHTAQWSWARLRAAPSAAPLPDGELPPEVTTWMDDGFYARWALGAFPPPDELIVDLLSVLDDPLRAQVRATLLEILRT